MTRDERAEAFAEQIRQAVRQDRRGGRTATIVKSINDGTLALANELERIADKLDSLTSKATGEPLSEDAKDDIAERTARKLGLPNPEDFPEVIRKASVQSFLSMLSDLQNIINLVK